MRNHYHLAIETPKANLVDGMHWVQGTFAAEFNRFRNARETEKRGQTLGFGGKKARMRNV